MRIRSETKIEADAGKSLSPREIAGWASALPDDAEVSAIMGDRGHQLNSVPFLRGLRATWERDAPEPAKQQLHSHGHPHWQTLGGPAGSQPRTID